VVSGCVGAGVERFLVTAVARDGTMEGPDLGLIEEIQRLAPGVAIVAAGGIGSLHHLTGLAALGIEGAVAGRALYEGAFTIEAALRELTAEA
jgi:phosphoribosylformimino-5-aminoimidazole carboxamide ribonucleotide (ProFAR) isomerase